MTARDDLSRDWYLERFDEDLGRMLEVLSVVDLDAPVSACPGWSAVDLVSHVGFVHRWARACAIDAAPPSKEQMATMSWDGGDDRDGLAAWFRAGADEIVATLREIDLDGPTWHPFPVPLVGRVWPRRQAHEICIHRWDLERAAEATTPLDPILAADGVAEWAEIAVPRLVARDGIALPEGPIHLVCSDVDGVTVRVGDDLADAPVETTVAGPAETLVLALWGRADLTDLEVEGDADHAAAWFSVHGM